MADRLVTYDDYNQHSREILMKVDIYFDGPENPPLSVFKTNYLISGEILEESGAEDANPLGAISANELTFSLHNKKGIFNPANTASIYYSKIKKGVMVKPYFKLVNADIPAWDPMGEFYVADWVTSSSGNQAEVTAYDKLQSVFEQKTPVIKIEEKQTFFEFFTRVFTALGKTATVDTALTQELLFTYVKGKPSEFLQEMMHGALAYCNCDKLGKIQIKAMINNSTPVTTITDNNQIVDLRVTQSVVKTYDGVELKYVLPQASDQTEILSLKGLTTPTGTKEHDIVMFSKTPVKLVCSLMSKSAENVVKVVGYEYTPDYVILKTENNGPEKACDYTLKGIIVDNVEAKLSDEEGSLLKVENMFIQNTAYAITYKEVLNKFTSNPIPIITLTIRGNPLLNIGDKIIVDSDKYALVYTGILLRAQYKYAGALSCEITLLNALILGGS